MLVTVGAVQREQIWHWLDGTYLAFTNPVVTRQITIIRESTTDKIQK